MKRRFSHVLSVLLAATLLASIAMPSAAFAGLAEKPAASTLSLAEADLLEATFDLVGHNWANHERIKAVIIDMGTVIAGSSIDAGTLAARLPMILLMCI